MPWSIRFCFTVSKPLNSDDKELLLNIGGREAILSSQFEVPLKDADWLVLSAHGFESEDTARNFGETIGRALLAAGAKQGVGIDLGEGRATSGFGKVIVDALAEKGVAMHPNVHGLYVYENHGNACFPRSSVKVRVLFDPEMFLNAVTSAVDEAAGLSEAEAAALTLIGLSRSAREPLAEAALCISAVELLSHDSPWTSEQLTLLEKLKQQAATSKELPEEEAEEVAKAIENGVFKSVRQSIKRKLLAIGMGEAEWKTFDRIYSLRSAVFHGDTGGKDKHRELANSARNICARIVTESIKQAHAPKASN